MTPTPKKMHYIFNLRDISKVLPHNKIYYRKKIIIIFFMLFQVFQGLLRSNIKHQNFKVPMLRLWCHEVFRVFYDRLIDEK